LENNSTALNVVNILYLSRQKRTDIKKIDPINRLFNSYSIDKNGSKCRPLLLPCGLRVFRAKTSQNSMAKFINKITTILMYGYPYI